MALKPNGALIPFSVLTPSGDAKRCLLGFSYLVGCSVWIPVCDGIVIAFCQLHILDAFALGILKLFLCFVVVLTSHIGEEHVIRNLQASCGAQTQMKTKSLPWMKHFSRFMHSSESVAKTSSSNVRMHQELR